MPFTASHPAAVLVCAAPLARWGLPVPALVIGSIAPDLFTMLPIPALVHFAHTLPGLFTADLAVGVAAFLTRQAFYGPALIAFAPLPMQARVAGRARTAGRAGLMDLVKVGLAVLLGALTHLLWDSFTHDWMWGPQHIGWLAERHGSLLGWQWVQKVSDLTGLVVVAVSAVSWFRTAPVRPITTVLLPLGHKVLAWLVILGPATIAFCALLLKESFYVAITVAAGLGVLGLTIAAFGLRRRRR
jgi:hypothetical protein